MILQASFTLLSVSSMDIPLILMLQSCSVFGFLVGIVSLMGMLSVSGWSGSVKIEDSCQLYGLLEGALVKILCQAYCVWLSSEFALEGILQLCFLDGKTWKLRLMVRDLVVVIAYHARMHTIRGILVGFEGSF
jgi:hypothetical protein